MIYLNLFLIFLIIIFIHELGHYSFARLFKVSVTDFSIGFGKVLFQLKDRYNTKWKFSLIPLGGYVKIKGLESIFRNNSFNTDKDSFQNISLSKKIIILLAGSLFNIISAWLVIFFILFFFGIINFTPIIGNVIENSAASKNDIRTGDLVLSVNDKKIDHFQDIASAINNNTSIKIEIIRNNKILIKEFDLIYDDNIKKYIIGITSNNDPEILKYMFIESFKQSVFFIPRYYLETIKYISMSFNNNTLTNELAGPIGIVKMADDMMLDKIKGVLFIFISISLFIGLFNLIPIPLLDGGHIIYFIIHSIFSGSLPSYITRLYLVTGVAIISFLFLIVTFNDIFYK